MAHLYILQLIESLLRGVSRTPDHDAVLSSG